MKKCQPRSLTPFLDGELTEDAWHELDDHLQTCPACSAQLDELTAAAQQVRAMGRAQIPRQALATALEVISGRAGLSPEAALTETTEIAHAAPAPEAADAVELDAEPGQKVEAQAPNLAIEADSGPVGETSMLARTPGPTLPEPLPEIGIPEGVYWDQPKTGMGPEAKAVDENSAPEAAAGVADDEPEHAPTWVEPERRHPAGLTETEAPAFAPPPEQLEEIAEAASVNADEAAAEQGSPAATNDPQPGAAQLEEHPSPPPPQIVPAWMEVSQASDAELERAGREAVDDAIGAPGEPAAETRTPSLTPAVVDEIGPTAAADVALRAEPETIPEADAETPPRWSWFGSLLGRGKAAPAAEVAPSELGAESTGATEPSIEGEAEPVVDRPEAERLMWITPRTSSSTPEAEPSIPAEVSAEPSTLAASPAEPSAEVPPLAQIPAQPSAEVPPLAAEAGPPVTGQSTPMEDATSMPDLPAPAAVDDEDETHEASHLRGYREALLWARATPGGARAKLLSSPQLRIRMGLGVALVLIVVAAVVLYATRPTHPSPAAVAKPATSHAATSSPASHATPSPPASAAPSPGTSPAGGQLTEVVTAGSGGSGWSVSRIRTGSPGNGITRVVLDLDGTGSTPSAQLGRASDGAIYLTVPGLSISPAVLSGLAPTGLITAITQADGAGTSLKFSPTGKPGFSVGYLAAPHRLVLDFK